MAARGRAASNALSDGSTTIMSWRSFFFSSRRRHTRCGRDWSSDVCSSDLAGPERTVVQIDAPDGAARHRTALGEIRADVELRTRGEIDLPVVDRLAHQLPVDVDRKSVV